MKHREIIERLEKATGADRELDGLLFGWLHKTEPCGTFMCGFAEEKFQFRHPDDAPTGRYRAWYVRGEDVPASTASIDAAVALVERQLPGWSWECRASGTGDKGQATVWNPSRAPGNNQEQRAYNCASPALAILIALFRALKAQGADHG